MAALEKNQTAAEFSTSNQLNEIISLSYYKGKASFSSRSGVTGSFFTTARASSKGSIGSGLTFDKM